MGNDPVDVVVAHATICRTDDIVAMRRTVYSAAIELVLGADAAHEVAPEVLDNPVVRGHLGAVLGGRRQIDPDLLAPLGARLTEAAVTCAGDRHVLVSSSPAASDLLAEALDQIRAELVRHHDHERAGTLLTGEDPDFGPAQRLVVAGLELAADLVPELVDDLLPHVGAFGLISQDPAGRLGSASVREWPGLIVLPRPQQPSEVAEALLHEGAHQKLFDLMLTRSVLASYPEPSPTFTPPWRLQPAPAWPFEQCLAAMHAYSVLAAAAPAFLDGDVELHEHSLLPHAADRACLLAEWLHEHPRNLGPDGRRLLGGLSRVRVSLEPSDLPPGRLPIDAARVVRHCGSWSLHVDAGPPSEIWWIPNASAGCRP
jgi:hypothetical protein